MARHSWPWCVDWIHRNVLWAGVSGGRRAWVSGGVHEWAAVGGLSHELQTGLPHELQTGLPHELQKGLPHELQAGLGEPWTAAWRSEPRLAASISPWTVGLREPWTADSRRSHRTPTLYQRAMEGSRAATSMSRDKHRQEQTKNFQKINKTKRGEWAPITVWVWSSVMAADSREECGTRRRGLNSK